MRSRNSARRWWTSRVCAMTNFVGSFLRAKHRVNAASPAGEKLNLYGSSTSGLLVVESPLAVTISRDSGTKQNYEYGFTPSQIRRSRDTIACGRFRFRLAPLRRFLQRIKRFAKFDQWHVSVLCDDARWSCQFRAARDLLRPRRRETARSNLLHRCRRSASTCFASTPFSHRPISNFTFMPGLKSDAGIRKFSAMRT